MWTGSGDAKLDRPIASCSEKPQTSTSAINIAVIRKNFSPDATTGCGLATVAMSQLPLRNIRDAPII
jgi:hypothetical protein